MIDAIHHFHGAFLVLFLVGLYTMIDDPNLIKKVMGLNVMQIAVFLLLITIAYPEGAVPPLLDLDGPHPNPLVHVLVLTAIVVGVALTALALALIVRLHDEFGTIHAREIEAALAADGGGAGSSGGDVDTGEGEHADVEDERGSRDGDAAREPGSDDSGGSEGGR